MNPIIDKIKKLLRLSKDGGATPAEAATAMAKALQLAADNGLRLEDIPPDSDIGVLTHETVKSTAGPAQVLAAGIVKEHFGVDTLFITGCRKEIHFIGLPEQVALAAYVYTYLVRTMCRAWRTRTNKRLRDRNAFLRGFSASINRLMPAVFHVPGIILCAKKYVDEVICVGSGYSKTTTIQAPKAKSDRAFSDGYDAGKKAGIRNAIRGTTQPLLPF
ncbi:MAG: DUF2786 domain-containing protein [Luteolibacter sp.]|uniref:DUF7168 domain-containing protein n=1 Tax=Luteolibacter sp. TaxID=1962973 RepID=UPI0032653EE1